MITQKDITKLMKTLNIFDQKSRNALSSIIYGFQKCKSLRVSRIAATMPGNYESNDKSITRAINRLDISLLLSGLSSFALQGEDLLLLDLTEMTRKNAKRTGYVGYLKDGITHGYNILTISVPYKGRSKVIFADVISSAIIEDSESGKWKLIQNSLEPILHLLRSKTIAIDREFCNEEMINFFRRHGIHYAIRLKLHAGRWTITITNRKGKRINLFLKRGSKKNWHSVYYKGKIKVNIAAEWQSGMAEPMYIVTDCEPSKGLKYYKIRMKIEESFKDIKDKLGFTKLMNKKLENLVKLILIGLLAYNILMLIGERLREAVLNKTERRRFSGLHLLFNMLCCYTRSKLKTAIRHVQKYLRRSDSNERALYLTWGSV
jgi:hypothetical protein